MIGGNAFGKTICPICYEDLKPIVEDLQSIQVCGHVFHELCLQQWFEYCTNSKRQSCPVCKQSCTGKMVCRLYFQSCGDQNELLLSQKVTHSEQDPAALRVEMKRLEGKVSGLTSALESRVKKIQEATNLLHLCEEKLKSETEQKDKALKEKAKVERLFRVKNGECDQLHLEVSKLQERNVALAKEIAAFKLVSDLSLEEGDVLKLASLGNEANKKDTVDTLVKSLLIRNRSYKELMAKCNLLGRSEARSSEKLVKAKEKIDNLQKIVENLESTIEGRDNKLLRVLKASKKHNERAVLHRLKDTSASPAKNYAVEDQGGQPSAHGNGSENPSITNSLCSDEVEDFALIGGTGANPFQKEYPGAMIDDSITKSSTITYGCGEFKSKNKRSDVAAQNSAPTSENDYSSDIRNKAQGPPYTLMPPNPKTSVNSEDRLALANPLDKDTEFNIRSEALSGAPLCKPGDICLSGGLRGPDGTNRYLGKWCKRGQSKGSAAAQRFSSGSGDLIAVGSDGRGGRVKVLRSSNQHLQDGKENVVTAKRFKHDTKSSNWPSGGRLQIEHFFGRGTE